MAKIIICKNCGKEKPANIRLKGTQEYCSAVKCQRARKAAWQRAKMDRDADYRDRQKQCVKNWQKNKPVHKYQNQYRQEHEDYVAKNREKQRIRNQKHRHQTVQEKIVKMDALPNQPKKNNGLHHDAI